MLKPPPALKPPLVVREDATTSFTVAVCGKQNPFFGFCFPQTATVNEVVASSRTTKGGFNAGGGFNIPLGESRLKFFMEARYHRMFSSNGADLTYVPLTVGIRW